MPLTPSNIPALHVPIDSEIPPYPLRLRVIIDSSGVSLSFSQSIHAQTNLCCYSSPFFPLPSHNGARRPSSLQPRKKSHRQPLFPQFYFKLQILNPSSAFNTPFLHYRLHQATANPNPRNKTTQTQLAKRNQKQTQTATQTNHVRTE
jgi:hypothetical protein